jgi:hypothetical protein
VRGKDAQRHAYVYATFVPSGDRSFTNGDMEDYLMNVTSNLNVAQVIRTRAIDAGGSGDTQEVGESDYETFLHEWQRYALGSTPVTSMLNAPTSPPSFGALRYCHSPVILNDYHYVVGRPEDSTDDSVYAWSSSEMAQPLDIDDKVAPANRRIVRMAGNVGLPTDATDHILAIATSTNRVHVQTFDGSTRTWTDALQVAPWGSSSPTGFMPIFERAALHETLGSVFICRQGSQCYVRGEFATCLPGFSSSDNDEHCKPLHAANFLADFAIPSDPVFDDVIRVPNHDAVLIMGRSRSTETPFLVCLCIPSDWCPSSVDSSLASSSILSYVIVPIQDLT